MLKADPYCLSTLVIAFKFPLNYWLYLAENKKKARLYPVVGRLSYANTCSVLGSNRVRNKYSGRCLASGLTYQVHCLMAA
jgi:hypothetical protein